MSESKPAAAAAPPPTADPQDPLPESNWVARRWFVFLLGAIAMAGVGVTLWMLYSVGDATLKLIADLSGERDVRALDTALSAVGSVIDALYKLGARLIGVVFALLIAYLIAPSAEQATKMIATVWAWKGGISTASTARSTSPDGSTAEATTTAGPSATAPAAATPAKPAAPAVPAAPADDPLPPHARDL